MSRITKVSMDCRAFQKQHFAYLDDTLPGDLMAVAQRHIMECDACAAHDTIVRRSLMMVKSLPSIEPSDEFRARLRVRLAECREQHTAHSVVAVPASWRIHIRSPYVLAAMAASIVVVGTFAWQRSVSASAPMIALEPVRVTRPASESDTAFPYLSPALVRAMATGNPVWPAALLVDDAPSQYLNTEGLTPVRGTR